MALVRESVPHVREMRVMVLAHQSRFWAALSLSLPDEDWSFPVGFLWQTRRAMRSDQPQLDHDAYQCVVHPRSLLGRRYPVWFCGACLKIEPMLYSTSNPDRDPIDQADHLDQTNDHHSKPFNCTPRGRGAAKIPIPGFWGHTGFCFEQSSRTIGKRGAPFAFPPVGI